MLTYNEAVVVGANACIDRLGRGFVEKYRETACNAFADVDDHVFCFVGVSDKPSEDISLDKPIMLDGDSESKFPYRVSCNVRYSDGEVSYVDCVLPGDT